MGTTLLSVWTDILLFDVYILFKVRRTYPYVVFDECSTNSWRSFPKFCHFCCVSVILLNWKTKHHFALVVSNLSEALYEGWSKRVVFCWTLLCDGQETAINCWKDFGLKKIWYLLAMVSWSLFLSNTNEEHWMRAFSLLTLDRGLLCRVPVLLLQWEQKVERVWLTLWMMLEMNYL